MNAPIKDETTYRVQIRHRNTVGAAWVPAYEHPFRTADAAHLEAAAISANDPRRETRVLARRATVTVHEDTP